MAELAQTAKLFRQFIKHTDYEDAESLMKAVIDNDDEQAVRFCEFALKLRYDDGTRRSRTLQKLRETYPHNNNWTGPLCIQLWSLYRCMKVLNAPNKMTWRESVFDSATKEQRLSARQPCLQNFLAVGMGR